MNVISKITLECMKKNKRRTIVTIVGVIISVAMVAAVSTITSSFLTLMQKNVIADRGDWYTYFDGVQSDKIDIMKNDSDVETSILFTDLGYAKLNGSLNSQSPYVFVSEYELEGMKQMPFKLIEGQLPSNDQEVMIPKSLLDTSGVTYDINDMITYDIGMRKRANSEDYLLQNNSYEANEYLETTKSKQYRITGVYDDANMSNSMQPGYLMISGLNETLLDPALDYQIKIKTKQISNDIYAKSQALAEAIEAENVSYNNGLLLYYGISEDAQFMTTIVTVVGIVGIIILIGSISLIYNAFAISLSERSRYLGMLSSIGATKRQKRNSVFYEALYIGLIAIPIGFLCGYAGIAITFQFVDPLLSSLTPTDSSVHLELVIDLLPAIGALLFSILILFISAWIPARRASKITPMDAIRQTNDIAIKTKHVKTSALTTKALGFEAELGLKNIKRNRNRYYVTLFSLMISIVLFLSVSAFRSYMTKSYTMTSDNTAFNVFVRSQTDIHNGRLDLAFNQMLNAEGAQTGIKSTSLSIYQDIVSLPLHKEVAESMKNDDLSEIKLHVISMDDASLKAYCEEIGADYESLQTEALRGILINSVNFQQGHEYREMNILDVENGDKLEYHYYNENLSAFDKLDVEVAHVTNQSAPMMQEKSSSLQSTLIVSEESIKALSEKLTSMQPDINITSNLFFQSDQATALETELLKVRETYGDLNISVVNMEAMMDESNQVTLFISIFLYGFTALILLICIANIFNTISTSIQLRKQEFAMLKSVGITPKGFRRMLIYENLFYGVKSLIYGIVISIIIMYLMYLALASNFGFAFYVTWLEVLMAIIGVFIIVGTTMLYSITKVKKDNIIETIKNESV